MLLLDPAKLDADAVALAVVYVQAVFLRYLQVRNEKLELFVIWTLNAWVILFVDQLESDDYVGVWGRDLRQGWNEVFDRRPWWQRHLHGQETKKYDEKRHNSDHETSIGMDIDIYFRHTDVCVGWVVRLPYVLIVVEVVDKFAD